MLIDHLEPRPQFVMPKRYETPGYNISHTTQVMAGRKRVGGGSPDFCILSSFSGEAFENGMHDK